MTEILNDAPIEEVRELRRQISARFADDPAQMIAYYLKLQEKYRDRLVASPSAEERKDQSAA
jgi:hypothetical protein